MNPNSQNIQNPNIKSSNQNNPNAIEQEKWRHQKKVKFWVIISLVLVFVLTYFSFKIFYHKPTCFDGKLNNGELNVDCGGVCDILCKDTQQPVAIKWSKVFDIGGARYIYSAEAINPNQNAEIKYSEYTFNIYEGDKLLLKTSGYTSFAPNERKILSGQFNFEGEPDRVTIEFKDNYFYSKSANSVNYKIREVNYVKSQTTDADLISFDAENQITTAYYNLIANIIIYDKDRQVIAFSKSAISNIDPLATKKIFFTWPKDTLANMQSYEVLFQSDK